MAGKKEELTPSRAEQVLEWAYSKSLAGMPGLWSAHTLANDYLKGNGSIDEKVASLIRWQTTKAATTGFVTGVGGLFTLPLAIPADFAFTIFIQIRMISAIAIMHGFDPRDDRVKTLTFAVLVGDSVKDVLEQFGIRAAGRVSTKLVQKIPSHVIKAIQKRLGLRFLTKFGQRGAVGVAKLVPLLGGVANGTMDAFSTQKIAKIAMKTFDELIVEK